MLFKLSVELFRKQVIIMAVVMALFVYLVKVWVWFKKSEQTNQRQVSVPLPQILLCRDMEISPPLPNFGYALPGWVVSV